MLDTMVITKAVAALCGALLIFLLGRWVAEMIYEPHNHSAAPAFVVDTGSPADDGAAQEQLSFDELFAAADPAAGARLWSQCRACHALEPGRNGVGPSLHGVVDRDIGAMAGFNYSGALAQAGSTWTPEVLSAFIEAPSRVTPGTSMNFRGIASASDRANLIAFIQSESR